MDDYRLCEATREACEEALGAVDEEIVGAARRVCNCTFCRTMREIAKRDKGGGGFVLGAHEEIVGNAFDTVSDYARRSTPITMIVTGGLGYLLGGPLVGAVGAGIGYWLSKR